MLSSLTHCNPVNYIFSDRHTFSITNREPNQRVKTMAKTPQDLKNASVEILCMSVTPPLIKKGRITCQGNDFCEVILDETESELELGTQIILDGEPENELRMTGMVVEVSGSKFRVETDRVVLSDKRSFPRMQGGIRVRYRVLSGRGSKAVSSAWLNGDEAPGREGDWWEPDPFMDFSGSGLKFDDQLHCAVEDSLLLELQVPSSEGCWHATARVVRIEPIPPEEKDDMDDVRRELAPTHQIAVEFIHIPKEATEAIATFTLRIQSALLRD